MYNSNFNMKYNTHTCYRIGIVFVTVVIAVNTTAENITSRVSQGDFHFHNGKTASVKFTFFSELVICKL